MRHRVLTILLTAAVAALLAACGDTGESANQPSDDERSNCLADGNCDPLDAIELGEFTTEQVAEAVRRFEYQLYAKRVRDAGGDPLSFERWKLQKGAQWVIDPDDIRVREFPKPPPDLDIPTCVPRLRRGPKGIPIFFCR